MSEYQVADHRCAAPAVAFAWMVRAVRATLELGPFGITPVLGIHTVATMHCRAAGRRGAVPRPERCVE